MDGESKLGPARPTFLRGPNLAEIHVPYVHYSDEPRDPDLQLPEDLLVYVYRMACKTATRCRRQCGATLLLRKEKSSLVSPPSTPMSPRSSMSSYFYAAPPTLTEDTRFILFSSSPLNTLLVPSCDPTFSLPRYSISRSVDYPSRGWVSATMKGGDMMARVELKPGSSKGAVLYGGRECSLKSFMCHGDPKAYGTSSLQFHSQELHAAKFTWTRDPTSSDLKASTSYFELGTTLTLHQCLVQHPAERLATAAATLSTGARATDHPTLVIRPESMDDLDMILLTMLIVENCWL
ncbi:hypothetical protein CALVIDRAFT_524461 [Calocera viscosa TUFC12733]|uniref:Uncharacterized protein n=1 Tax=Calocera viscosa (strain TUFC12733) TaxID=1330018 RepID=A0A167R9C4_CALVF|nr:hypothetical protein CALVIDRAFT_524461 [Calocera viscosa TUFC12733]